MEALTSELSSKKSQLTEDLEEQKGIEAGDVGSLWGWNGWINIEREVDSHIMWQTCHQQLPFKDFQGILEKNNDMVMEWGWFMAGLPHHDCRWRYGYIYIYRWMDRCRYM